MYHIRDDYEKEYLTKRLKTEQTNLNNNINQSLSQTTNTFIMNVDQLAQKVYFYILIKNKLISFYFNSHLQLHFLIENDDLVIHKKFMQEILQHFPHPQI
jgi:hypothetical protein